MPTIDKLELINSTSYIDLLGLQVGLDRLLGESTIEYLHRLEAAASLMRNHSYEGACNEVNLQLGFTPEIYMHVETTSKIEVSIKGISIGSNPIVSIVTFDNDSMWRWKLLSDIILDLNSLQGVAAVLLVDDGPAFQLAKQSNSLWSFGELVDSMVYAFKFPGIVAGSESFSAPVPSYVISNDKITFDSEPPTGLTVTYNYLVTPYDIVGSPISILSLTDPTLSAKVLSPKGEIAYQIQETIQTIMQQDRSYWGK